MRQRVVWFDVPARDLERALRFYTAVLGGGVRRQQFGEVTVGLFVDADDQPIGALAVADDFHPSTDGVMLYFSVEGRLRDAVEAARAAGGIIQRDVHAIGPYGFRAEIVDSEGNGIALHAGTDA